MVDQPGVQQRRARPLPRPADGSLASVHPSPPRPSGLYFGILTRDCAEVASDRIARSLGTGRKMAVSVRDCGICGGELGDDGPLSGPGAAAAAAAGAAGGSGGGKGLGTIQLSCKHLFHMECVRGWCIIGARRQRAVLLLAVLLLLLLLALLAATAAAAAAAHPPPARHPPPPTLHHAGKKDTCPTCWEKVDLKSVFADKPWETRNLSWCAAWSAAGASALLALCCRRRAGAAPPRAAGPRRALPPSAAARAARPACLRYAGFKCSIWYGIWWCGTQSSSWPCSEC